MKKICGESFVYSLGAGVWIALVALLMTHANSLFGKVNSIISGTAMLLLFSLSALVVGGLLVGKPIFLYIDGKKKEAVWMLLANAGWILLFLIILLINLAITK